MEAETFDFACIRFVFSALFFQAVQNLIPTAKNVINQRKKHKKYYLQFKMRVLQYLQTGK